MAETTYIIFGLAVWLTIKHWGGGGGGGGLQPPEPPWDIGTSPTEYENLILLFSSDSFDLGFYSLYCYRFLFLAPPNLFLVHSVFHIVTEDGWLYSS